jgi:uncharacterized protein
MSSGGDALVGAGLDPRLAQLPVHAQLAAFTDIVAGNGFVSAVLARADELALPAWYLTAGCLFQTVWNAQHGYAPAQGIQDYDLFYFDDSDLSWEAEDLIVKRCARAFADLPIKVEARNQARVHLWYAQKFGTHSPAFRSCEDGIDSFLATTCCLGLRQVGREREVYAPHGFADLFGMMLRPNLARVAEPGTLREVYETKARRWAAAWPRLRVMPWPSGD